MKAGYLCILFFIGFSFSVCAQEINLIERPEFQSHSVSFQNSSSCNCLIPLDSTFSIVHFDYSGGSGGPGVPPDYRNDDWSSGPIVLPFNFCYSGQLIDTIYINNNGNISIGSPYSTFSAIFFPGPSLEIIAPFWADVDTRGLLSGIVYYKVTSSSLVVIWNHVGYFPQMDDKLNTFQLIITDGNDPTVPNGNVAFCYGNMEWTTGAASGGVNGFGGSPAQVGANRGDGIIYTLFGLYDQPGNYYDGPLLSNDGVDMLDSSNFIFDLCAVNISPVSLDCMNDTIIVHVADTALIDFNFLSPEDYQITVINLQSGALNNFSILSNDSGVYAHTRAQVIADATNVGYNTIAVIATDNGSPAEITSYYKVLQILPFNGISTIDRPSVSIFPNPTYDESTLTIKNYPFQNIIFTVSDITGRVIFEKNLYSNSFVLSKNILGNGLFIYNLNNKAGLNITGKLLIY